MILNAIVRDGGPWRYTLFPLDPQHSCSSLKFSLTASADEGGTMGTRKSPLVVINPRGSPRCPFILPWAKMQYGTG